jgi:predicted DNA-binding transcriptional regulator YafY
MKLEADRPGVYTVTLTSHELSALLAGARMSLSLMDTDPAGATAEARAALSRVLDEFDRELARTRESGGEPD